MINEKIAFIKNNNFTPNSNRNTFSEQIKNSPDSFHIFKLTYSNFDVEFVTRKIQKIVKDITPNFKISFAYTTPKLSQIILKQLKPQLNMFEKSALIYQFTCPCGESYVGETTRPLLTRIKEHNQPSRNTAIFNHTSQCTIYQNSLPKCTTKKHSSYTFHFKSFFKVLATNLFNYTHRINTEAIFISLLAPSINEQCDFKKLRVF